ncbi:MULTISPECIES: hypothetical protein [Paenibacillus]|uniref:Gram-positive cocci surface proteins LPxTG domain-containing protein n=1 Tax=Paenibacillus borealis TaxID=160799 RepID=A0ABX3GYL0_PAEBO|nr:MULTISPECIES: hypothetical protein [Paenibacillus]AIQ19753.1 hypothetical protein H70357_25830 [Paenibacillus sp. FSL H7-0357]OMD40633.1 hypothetical protein BSK56_28395 [Paenibacillus borealis]
MRKAALLVLLFTLFLPAPSTSALSCVQLLSMEAAYDTYDGVVIGHVEDVVQISSNNQIHMTVVRSFKTITEPSLVVDENMTWGAMNGPSEEGSDYLFFLRQKDGKWENPLCSPSVKISDAYVDLEFLKDKEISISPSPSPTVSPAAESPSTASAANAGAEPAAGQAGDSRHLWIAAGIAGVGLITGLFLLRYFKRNR